MCGRVGLARRGDDCGDKKGEAMSCGGRDGGAGCCGCTRAGEFE